MIQCMNPHALPEIVAEITRTNQLIFEYFSSIEEEAFFAHPAHVWSPAENLAHLSKSVRAATLGLKVPQAVSGLIWGAAESRSFAELVSEYRQALAEGGESPPEFVAEIPEPIADKAATRQAVLQRWQQSAAKLAAAAASWDDEDLDKARVPHPLLGKLTIRELLFFTLYHNLHHMNDARRLLGEADVEV